VALRIHYRGQAPLSFSTSSALLSTPTHTPLYLTSDTVRAQEAQVTLAVQPAPEDIEVLVTNIQLDNPSPTLTPHPTAHAEVEYSIEPVVEKQMKAAKTKVTIGVLSTLISYVSLNSLYKTLHPEAFIWQEEDWEEDAWVATSKSWLDRKACRWLGVCGAAHMHLAGPHFGNRVHNNEDQLDDRQGSWDWQNAWTEGADRPEDWTDDEQTLREIPDYVFEHAPLVHLFSGEQFWPCDIAEHLYHVTPTLNYTPLPSKWDHPTLQNLDDLNRWEHGRYVFLTSNDNVEERPEWLEGEKNIPVPPPQQEYLSEEDLIHTPGRTYTEGVKQSVEDLKEWFQTGEHSDDETHTDLKREAKSKSAQQTMRGGRSDAPAVLIVVNKGQGIVDAFWFFFYSFNLGNVVFNIRFGNHVGDWEHVAIRFHNSQPKAVFFSEHSFGSAYSFDAVEKIGKRPVIYSALGTHAMYATPGLHPYILPWGILHDETDEGPLWDPILNSHAFTYDYKNDTLRSSNLTPEAPIGWFHYAGHWGDKFYPLSDKRQYRFAGQYHYVNGPLGPKFKNLARKKICGGPDSEPCVIKNWLSEGSIRLQRFHGPGEGDELSSEDIEKFFGNGKGYVQDI
jgi:Vacuolar protein sorting-associated protein 62